jgi:hypothetical protein
LELSVVAPLVLFVEAVMVIGVVLEVVCVVLLEPVELGVVCVVLVKPVVLDVVCVVLVEPVDVELEGLEEVDIVKLDATEVELFIPLLTAAKCVFASIMLVIFHCRLDTRPEAETVGQFRQLI